LVSNLEKKKCQKTFKSVLKYSDPKDWIIYTSLKLPIVAEARLKKAVEKVIKWTNKNGF
jgi:hypothetical protein